MSARNKRSIREKWAHYISTPFSARFSQTELTNVRCDNDNVVEYFVDNNRRIQIILTGRVSRISKPGN